MFNYSLRTAPEFEEGQQYHVDFRRIGGKIARDPLDSAETQSGACEIQGVQRVGVSATLARH